MTIFHSQFSESEETKQPFQMFHRIYSILVRMVTGSSSSFPLFYNSYNFIAPQIFKLTISTNFSFIFILKYPMTQFSILIVSWIKYF